MPKVLFVIDSDFEQRYYLSPESAARGILGWAYDDSVIYVYRLIEQDCDGMPLDLEITGQLAAIKARYKAWHDRNYHRDARTLKAKEKEVADEMCLILERFVKE